MGSNARRMPRSAHRPPQLRRGPFRSRDVIAAGLLTPDQLRSAAWRQLGRGVYIDAELAVTPFVRIQAAELWLPAEAVVTARSAAQIWGVDLTDPDNLVEVVSAHRIRPMPGIVGRAAHIAPDEVTVHRGIRLTTPLHTAWEIARALPEVSAIGWIDALARRRRLSRRELRSHARRHVGEPGSRAAGRTLALCDPRAESPPESRLRIEMLRAGLPVPVPQFDVLVDGFFVARLDFAWPAFRFGVEYDGQWHADTGQLHRDRSRLRELNAAGWRIFHVTREDMRDVPALMRQIAAALAQASSIL
jgi:very-short-patch-repair endonuclease